MPKHIRKKRVRKAKTTKKARKVVSAKIKEVMKKGVRGKKVKPGQAIAIGLATARKKGFKIPKPRKKKKK